MKFPLKLVLVLASIAVVLLLVSISLKSPEGNRDWSQEFSKTMSATYTQEGKVAIKNVRNWTYGDLTILEKEWEDITVDPARVTQVWFVTEPFSSWEAVGHTFLSFEFEDGTVLSFSVEAKREVGEDYSAIRGLFKEYELAYQWGTERDFIARRLLYLDHPIHRYPLSLTSEMREGLFRGVIEKTNTLAETPRFYNTLTENCTNALAHIVNDIAPNTLPYDIAWQLTGYADLYLMDQGFIALGSATKEEVREAYDLTKKKAEIQNVATIPPKEFTAQLNSLLEE
ncbi:DUF4105 domain-containing protein [Patescibacteria group bacterium]|nr:DUF4105 domain-containing protein [Patescibacteria group bacterium]MBU1500517.1 DUF4105 domain-containing protein [Patescibacteria group bacterium]MBU2080684.1 DUF4105 domain-containing protein [Patescibacteria group bacterium]MBU2123789.1 DUF4105 domain-containing protein [Patescibacteria group bacterium]MBU2194920.1 DUF4105 domain-containing protein [Patescibacteria group bacterium]